MTLISIITGFIHYFNSFIYIFILFSVNWSKRVENDGDVIKKQTCGKESGGIRAGFRKRHRLFLRKKRVAEDDSGADPPKKKPRRPDIPESCRVKKKAVF